MTGESSSAATSTSSSSPKSTSSSPSSTSISSSPSNTTATSSSPPSSTAASTAAAASFDPESTTGLAGFSGRRCRIADLLTAVFLRPRRLRLLAAPSVAHARVRMSMTSQRFYIIRSSSVARPLGLRKRCSPAPEIGSAEPDCFGGSDFPPGRRCREHAHTLTRS